MSDRSFNLKDYLHLRQQKVNQVLEQLLPPAATPPCRLHEAMRYSVFAGGKRLRPILVIASAETLESGPSEDWESAILQAGAAVEILHTYSLIHDDLPAMDNDDLRRGKPTCHKAFDEATAILAGDALQSLAFQLLAELPGISEEDRVACVLELTQSVGSMGMAGGQMEDLICEGCELPELGQVERIHRLKTACLLSACCGIGARLGGGSAEEVQKLRNFGTALGLAFQIIDDILDVIGDQEKIGKTVGKDHSSSKATYPAVFSLQDAREKADALIREAKNCLASFQEKSIALLAISDYVATRDR